MVAKLGRNDPCWCGSGVKYKKCHLDRHKQEPITEQDYLKGLKKSFSQKYCLPPKAPQLCRGDIIRAHTIQRSGVLDRLARNGHVYHFMPPPTAAIRPTSLRATLIGYKDASTFTGFCGHHDANTFAPIETNPLHSSQEHAFLLAYRMLCKEIFLKKADLDAMSIRRAIDKGQPLSNQYNLQPLLTDHEEVTKVVMDELSHHKRAYDKALLTKDYSNVSYYVIRFAETPDIMSTGVMKPEYNFDGSQL